jgi:protein SCO1/2
MQHQSGSIKLLPVVAIGLCALGIGVWASLQLSAPQRTPFAAGYSVITVLPTPRALPELEFTNLDAQTISQDAFAGRWSLVFMGFTSCGHTCPMTLAEIRTIHGELDKPLKVVFFSVDPGRDDPETLKAYVKGFDASFTGMTATPEEIEKFAAALGAPYFVDTNPDDYIVEHSSAVFLIDPSASLAGIISQPFEIEQIVTELNALL